MTRREPVKMRIPRVLSSEIALLVREAKRHAAEIYGDESVVAANKILAVWLWHAVRGDSSTFLPQRPKRKRLQSIEGVEGR